MTYNKICPQSTINAVWNKIMLAYLILGKDKVIAELLRMDNPLSRDLAIRVELTDKPYFIGGTQQ